MLPEQPEKSGPDKNCLDEDPRSSSSHVERSLAPLFEHGQQLSELAARYESQLAELRAAIQRGSISVDHQNFRIDTIALTGAQTSHVDAIASCEAKPLLPNKIQQTPTGHLEHEGSANSLESGLSDETSQEEVEVFALWIEWTATAHHPHREYSRQQINQSELTKTGSGFGSFDKTLNHGIFYKYLLIEPTSRTRMLWDTFTICFLAYDAFVFPLKTFEYESTTASAVLNQMTTIFWTLDIYMNFVSGVQRFGMIEHKFRKIAGRYLRSWFLPDIVIVTVDWILVATKDNSMGFDLVRLGKFLRVLHVVRIFRLVRVMKAVRLLRHIGDTFFENLEFGLVFDILKYVCAIILVNHFIACAWHALSVTTDKEKGWVAVWRAQNTDVEMKHQYVSAFHWSVCQFTPAPNTVHPQNIQERIFAIAVLLLGLAVFSSFLGSITSLLTRERTRIEDQSHHVDCVHRYLADNEISLSVGNNIMSVIRKNLAKQRQEKFRLRREDVQYFKFLPKSMAKHLNFEVFSRVFIDHPVLIMLRDKRHLPFTMLLCQHAMCEQRFGSGFEIFSPGINAEGMLFLRNGSATYKLGAARRSEGSALSDEASIELKDDASLCEMVLWISSWKHKGHLFTGGGCFIIQVKHDEFRNVACAQHTTLKYLRKYARKYLTRLKEVAETETIDDRGITPPTLDRMFEGGNSVGQLTSLTSDMGSIATDADPVSSGDTDFAGTPPRNPISLVSSGDTDFAGTPPRNPISL